MNGEATIKLTWKGRLRVLLTGKVKLSEHVLRYMLGGLSALHYEPNED